MACPWIKIELIKTHLHFFTCLSLVLKEYCFDGMVMLMMRPKLFSLYLLISHTVWILAELLNMWPLVNWLISLSFSTFAVKWDNTYHIELLWELNKTIHVRHYDHCLVLLSSSSSPSSSKVHWGPQLTSAEQFC